MSWGYIITSVTFLAGAARLFYRIISALYDVGTGRLPRFDDAFYQSATYFHNLLIVKWIQSATTRICQHAWWYWYAPRNLKALPNATTIKSLLLYFAIYTLHYSSYYDFAAIMYDLIEDDYYWLAAKILIAFQVGYALRHFRSRANSLPKQTPSRYYILISSSCRKVIIIALIRWAAILW